MSKKYASDWIERNNFYREISSAEPGVPHYEQYARPVIVCLCGSTKFRDAFEKANYDETMAGKIVLSVGFFGRLARQRVVVDGCMGPTETEVLVALSGEGVGCTTEQKTRLDVLHKEKINLADEVLVLNVGGYVGDSTRSEVLHAHKTGKIITWLEPHNIPQELTHIGLTKTA